MEHQQTEEAVDVQQLTSFHENATVVQNEVRDVMPYTETLAQLVDSNDVTDFLGRPQIILTGNFSNTDLTNAVLAQGNVRTYLNSVQMWYRKIAGYRMLRGKVHLRLQVNGNPFQQGRLLLHFLPCESNYSDYNTVYTNSHNVNLCQKTQQPSIELDIQESTCELSIPYVAPTMFYDRTIDQFDWGSFYLSVLSPLKVGAAGQTRVEYTLFMYFTDVELSGPIFGPESGAKAANKRLVSERKKVVRTGEISSILGKVSEASGIFEDVPIIGAVASSISSLAGKFADAFSIFGWSKPNSDQTASIMTINPARNFVNCDGENYGDVMALNHTGALPIVAGFAGTDIDEMSFAFLKKVEAYFTRFTWSTDQIYDSSLYQLLVAPKSIYQEGTTTSVGSLYTYRSAPPFSWLSRMFKYYRGGIRLTFKLVKTQFHSGRLLIQFTTNNDNNTNAQSAYVLREIVDIRTTNEFSIVVPYIRATNYIETDMNDLNDDEYTALGRLKISVLNELRAPETASQSLEVLVYASAADDFELAYPQNYKQCSFSAESGIGGDMKMEEKPIGNSTHETSDILNNNMTIGDPFTSIKQLLMCYRRTFINAAVNTAQPYNLKIWPFALAMKYPTPSLGDISDLVGDYISELSSGYVLSRGSIRIALPSNTADYTIGALLENNAWSAPGSTPVVSTSVSNDFSSYAATNFEALFTNYRFGEMEIRRNAQWGTEITVPHFGQTPSRLNRFGETIPDNIDTNNCLLNLQFQPAVGNIAASYKTPNFIFRAAGDDFCLGYFIGFSPYLSGCVTIP